MTIENFDELAEIYRTEVYHHCLRIIRNKEDASEISSEAFIKAYIHRDQFDPQKGNFRNWIFTIATHLALDFLDSASQRRHRQTISIDDLIYIENGELQPDAHSEQEQLLKFIDDCLDQLTEQERLAVSFRHLQDFTLQETAKILGMSSPNSAKSRIKAGEKKLKRCLEKKGIDDDYWQSA